MFNLDALNDTQKKYVEALLCSRERENELHKEILSCKTSFGRYCHVLFECDGLALVENSSKDHEDAKYTSVVKIDGAWRTNSRYFSSVDMAILSGIGFKYDGSNTQFESFAGRMLKID